ncbi:vanadium-dependent haloperoxidase [Niabella soli]|uniref:Vanadium-dependent haloperoxidase n=1 Tax=Niabella soli DSM 19437 TaxID=929713 RepID=W0F3Q3_9BACT|nr:vanadium-dependent haloperoxidase [Niabella soli]AHF16124.1 vanadium-dependent haloperoxidase [Niabella soli DSM 19437]
MTRKILLGLLLFYSCGLPQKQPRDFDNIDISQVITRMTEVMVHDITSPPLAARFYSYACLAGYEVLAANNDSLQTMRHVLNGYPVIKKNKTLTGYNVKLSALLAMLETAGSMQPSGYLLKKYEQQFLDSCKNAGLDAQVIDQSHRYATYISDRILAYAKADGYNKLSALPKYTPLGNEGNWYPTPPAFMQAVEPYFNKVRPFTLDSAAQFKPAPPVAFSKSKESGFYTLMMGNYKEMLDSSKKTIAAFWDCNPFAVQDNGHLMAGVKKISPGAHWLGITGIVCATTKKSFEQTMFIYTTMSVGLMDAFISCWDEKFRSNRIRPETAIRKYIDPTWEPLLQTPPFPEYTSGHSVASATSATILTHYFGDNFPFTDSVEVSYGLPPRKFASFQNAAIEAGLSRFFGGIHFMDAINNGREQGLKVGARVLEKISAGSKTK